MGAVISLKEPKYILVCRSAFCITCYNAGRPSKGNRFIVYGTDNQKFKQKTAHIGGIKGFTPHLFSIPFPYKENEDGTILAVKNCLINDCGIEMGKTQENGDFKFAFTYVEQVHLTRVSADALISLWKSRTGYELL